MPKQPEPQKSKNPRLGAPDPPRSSKDPTPWTVELVLESMGFRAPLPKKQMRRLLEEVQMVYWRHPGHRDSPRMATRFLAGFVPVMKEVILRFCYCENIEVPPEATAREGLATNIVCGGGGISRKS